MKYLQIKTDRRKPQTWSFDSYNKPRLSSTHLTNLLKIIEMSWLTSPLAVYWSFSKDSEPVWQAQHSPAHPPRVEHKMASKYSKLLLLIMSKKCFILWH